MNNHKHTPAPWICNSTSNHAHDYRLVLKNGKSTFSAVCNDHTEQYANAKLIAAAPEMLEALEFIVDAFRDHPDFKDNATTEDGQSFSPINMARTAINKALGIGV